MITVSIVTYNNCTEDVFKCLSSFIDNTLISKVAICENSEVPILDAKTLIKFNRKIVYIKNPTNPGYGAGHNTAYASVKGLGLYHVIMNLDVFADSNVFTTLSHYMEKNSDICHVMPKVLNENGSIQRLCKQLPTPWDLIGRRFFGHSRLSKHMNKSYTLEKYDYEYEIDCPYLSGCFMFVRQSDFVGIGGFDEQFFMYPEDIDLTRRLNEIGRTVCYPHVSIVHQHGQASYKSRRMLIVHMKGIIKYFNKWGWFFDKKRTTLNRQVIKSIR